MQLTLPNTKEGWTDLYKSVSTMTQETCEKILDASKWAHNAMVLLDYRKEVSKLCISKGVNRFVW